MPDLFLMNEDGEYFGVSNQSYARWHNYPNSIEHWMKAEGSDAGRYFNIDCVELDEEIVKKFDELTKEYINLEANTPVFNEEYPSIFGKSKKAYRQAVNEFMEHHAVWAKESNIAYYTNRKRELWNERTRLFCTFSKKVTEAISCNYYIRYGKIHFTAKHPSE